MQLSPVRNAAPWSALLPGRVGDRAMSFFDSQRSTLRSTPPASHGGYCRIQATTSELVIARAKLGSLQFHPCITLFEEGKQPVVINLRHD